MLGGRKAEIIEKAETPDAVSRLMARLSGSHRFTLGKALVQLSVFGVWLGLMLVAYLIRFRLNAGLSVPFRVVLDTLVSVVAVAFGLYVVHHTCFRSFISSQEVSFKSVLPGVSWSISTSKILSATLEHTGPNAQLRLELPGGRTRYLSVGVT